MFDIPCIIFAGGKSSRMGEDKSLLPFGDFETLAQFQYERMQRLFSEVYISSKSNKFGFTCKVIEDPKSSDFAPTAGFVATFDALHVERIFVLSVDTPFVDEHAIKALIDADGDNDATIAKTASGTHPMCGIYHQSLHVMFQQMLQNGDHRLGKLLQNSNTVYKMFEDESFFANLNHPHEYEEAFAIISQRNM